MPRPAGLVRARHLRVALPRGAMLQCNVHIYAVTWRKYAAHGRIRETITIHACFHASAHSLTKVRDAYEDRDDTNR